MTELEKTLLDALKRQDNELEAVHERIEQQQAYLNQLTQSVEQLTELSNSVNEQLRNLQRTLKNSLNK